MDITQTNFIQKTYTKAVDAREISEYPGPSREVYNPGKTLTNGNSQKGLSMFDDENKEAGSDAEGTEEGTQSEDTGSENTEA